MFGVSELLSAYLPNTRVVPQIQIYENTIGKTMAKFKSSYEGLQGHVRDWRLLRLRSGRIHRDPSDDIKLH